VPLATHRRRVIASHADYEQASVAVRRQFFASEREDVWLTRFTCPRTTVIVPSGITLTSIFMLLKTESQYQSPGARAEAPA
jgi:hypothetical protein